MPNRRIAVRHILAGGSAALVHPFALAGPQGLARFDALMTQALDEIVEIDRARSEREGLAELYHRQSLHPGAPRRKPSPRAISDRAVSLITLFEVTSRRRYERLFEKPIWPGGGSGVTIGVGYDLGFVDRAWFEEDWKDLLAPKVIADLGEACRLRGPAAELALARLDHIRIDWKQADTQFRTTSLPRYVAETLAALPKAGALSDDSLGALVSLVHSRGPSFESDEPRYREMKAIAAHIQRGQFALVPREFARMKEQWAGLPKMEGLLKRRDLEAALFEAGL